MYAQHGPRPAHAARNVLVTVLLLGATMTIATDAANAAGPGSILVVDSGHPEDTIGLANAGYSQCPSNIAGPTGCWVEMSAADFTLLPPVAYQDYSVLYVGWTPVAATMNALFAQAANIDAWVDGGGTVVAYAQWVAVGSATPFGWIPQGSSVATGTTHANDVNPTTLGSTHPAQGGLTASQLSGWGNSRHNYFTSWPSYLKPLSVTNGGHEVTLSGHYGAGCVLVTGQDPDWHATYNGGTSQANAIAFLDANIQWAYECDCGDTCTPSLELTGTPTHHVTDPVGPSRARPVVAAVANETVRTVEGVELVETGHVTVEPGGTRDRTTLLAAAGSMSLAASVGLAPLSLDSFRATDLASAASIAHAEVSARIGGLASLTALANGTATHADARTLPTTLVPFRPVILPPASEDDLPDTDRDDDPWYTGSVTVDLNRCNCIATGYNIRWTVIDDDGDIHGVDEFIGPEVTQVGHNPPKWVVSAADWDTYHIDFTVFLVCDGVEYVLTKSWYQTN